MKRVVLFGLLALLATGCTPGGQPASTLSAVGGNGVVTIDVNLTLHGLTSTPAGPVLGYSPPVTSVAVGDAIQFVNSDNTVHTATFVSKTAYAPPLPDGSSPIGSASLTVPQSAQVLSQAWTTGALPAGTASGLIRVDQPGTYFYGCFYHYLGKMRGEIVAQ